MREMNPKELTITYLDLGDSTRPSTGLTCMFNLEMVDMVKKDLIKEIEETKND